MARPRSAPLAAAPKGFVASAVNLPTMDRNVAGSAQGWQTRAWTFWESVGELRYPSSWIGNVMSRAELHAAHREGNELVPATSGPAAEAMDALFNGRQGQAEMLQAFGVHLTVAGESYLVHLDKGDEWFVLSTGKVRQVKTKGTSATGEIVVELGRAGGAVPIGPNDFILRVWTPHPRDTTKADSPTRAVLTTLEQIMGYDAHIMAQLESRLSGAGILLLPSEIDFAVPDGSDPAASQASSFLAVLAEAMTTPIKNRASAAAVVPLVVMAPGEHLSQAQHLKFWSDLDAKVTEMRDAAIKRLALGLDVPPEVLLGVADANHWNAWLSEESAIKAHLEPRLSIVSHGLTTGYLRPALEGEVPDPENWEVIADTAAIRLRPNRSAEAMELYDRGELSGAALLRETGFQPVDAPSPEEVRTWLLRKVATGASSPEQSIAALAELGAGLNMGAPSGELNRPPPDNIRTDTAPTQRVRALPERRDAERRAATPPGEPLVAACEVLVYRALERAGNRLRNLHRLTDTSAMQAHAVYQLHTGEPDHLLEGAWECASDVLGAYCDDAANVVDVLDFYTRGLLSTKRPPSQVVLTKLLDTRPAPLEVGT